MPMVNSKEMFKKAYDCLLYTSVKCCGRRLWGAEGKRQPCGLLPPKAAKRPAGVSKYKGCALSLIHI